MSSLPTLEALFNRVVQTVGGERVDTLMDLKNPPPNADYVFRKDNVVVELKTLENQTFGPDHRQKTAKLFAEWFRKGRLMVFGTARVDLERLPADCQEEWLNVLASPMQRNVLQAANKQIRATKELLNLPDAKGILLVATDGNLDLAPNTIFYLIRRLLNKKHADGTAQYSQINAFAYFSGRTLVQVGPNGRPSLMWLNCPRAKGDEDLVPLLSRLARSWHDHLAQMMAKPLERLDISYEQIRDIRFAGAPTRMPKIDVASALDRKL